MSRELVYRRRARTDLAGGAGWYEEQREGLGGGFVAAAETCCQSLTHHPERFAEVHAGVRRALVSRFPWAVFYLVEPRRVVILGVLHSARNPALWPRVAKD